MWEALMAPVPSWTAVVLAALAAGTSVALDRDDRSLTVDGGDGGTDEREGRSDGSD